MPGGETGVLRDRARVGQSIAELAAPGRFFGVAGQLWWRRGKRGSFTVAGLQGLSGGWARGSDARGAHYRREQQITEESRGDRQRQLRVQLHAEPDRGFFRHRAGGVRLGARWTAGLGRRSVIAV